MFKQTAADNNGITLLPINRKASSLGGGGGLRAGGGASSSSSNRFLNDIRNVFCPVHSRTN